MALRRPPPSTDANRKPHSRSHFLNSRNKIAASVLVLLWKMEIEALPYSYAFGWVLMLAYELPAMLRYLRKNKM